MKETEPSKNMTAPFDEFNKNGGNITFKAFIDKEDTAKGYGIGVYLVI